MVVEIVIFIAAAAVCFAIYAIIQFRKAIRLQSQVDNLRSKYERIISVDETVEQSRRELETLQKQIQQLREDYAEKKAIHDKLLDQVAIYDESIKLGELGFYKPHFDFDTAEHYKQAILSVRQKQKTMLSEKTAIICNTEWEVEGSKAKGATMTNRNIRMTARAFNNECDAAIANTAWNNVTRMERRIVKAFEAINKLNASNNIHIRPEYLQLKLEELQLVYEHKEKVQQEKEEQRAIREQMREEARLEKDLLASQKEEAKLAKMVEKARREAQTDLGEEMNAMSSKLQDLERQLADAHSKSERALSMAQQTRTGHVYIISNEGSFGEEVYKIGMTRRLEPLDRVKELGDASVPFEFDVHAIVHSTDAPGLESALHKEFNDYRVNLVNPRKEFFRVSLTAIKQKVHALSPEAEFYETVEARQYRETQLLLERRRKLEAKAEKEELPEAI